MKKLIISIRDFISEDFNAYRYVFSILLLISVFYLRFSGQEYEIQRALKLDYAEFYLFKFTLYFFFFFVFSGLFRSIKPIIFIIVAVFILYFNLTSKNYARLLFDYLNLDLRLYEWFRQTFINFQKLAALGLPLFITFFLQKRELPNFYGMSRKNFEAKPYIIMLAVMLPLIFAASFNLGFQKMYPRYVPGSAEKLGLISNYLSVGVFELSYFLRFVAVELFFRGFLIIGAISIFGKRAILPAACIYSIWHFGKPMGEAIGAFFGGYILGILAYRTKSIFGGIAIHYGVALFMEAAAWSQILFFL